MIINKTFSKILTAFFLLAVVTLFSCGKDSGGVDVVPDDDDDSDTTIVDNGDDDFPIDEFKTFVHPGMLHDQDDFDRVKQKVDAGAQPWIDGWNKLTANSHASLSYNPSPTRKLIRGGGSREEPDPDNYSHAFNDAAAAYQCAIRWKISGNTAYADKAVQILNAWTSTCDTITGNSNIALGAGIYGYQFANAAELVRDYDGWSDADFAAFQQWMLDVFYSVNHAFLETHWGTCISHYWANWDLANLASVMAVGILTDRADLYNEAVTYLIDGAGNGQIKKAIYFIHPDNLGQMQESGRDQGHATLCIGLLGEICEMAWKQGDDLYGYDDNRVLKGAEYEAKYNYANLSVPFEPYNNCENWASTVISEDGRGTKRPIWERIYNHYVVMQGIPAPNVEIAARVHRPEGGGGDYGPNSGGFDSLGFGTLMYSLDL